MRWLQFSDIHLNGLAKGTDTILLQRQLLQYLEKEIDTVDKIFLTGDYRFRGQSKEIDETWEWIQTVAFHVGITDLQRQVYMVPGNHDVDRSSIRGGILDKIKRDYHVSEGRFEEDVLDYLLKGFSYFDSLHRKVKQCSYIEESMNRGNPHRMIDCGDFYLLLLNTALLSNEDGERGSLLAGTGYVAELAPENGKPVMVLAHHGLEMLDRKEQKKLKQIFREWGVKLYLCGDAHELGVDYIGEKCYQVTCGCLKSEWDKTDITFTEGEITGDKIWVKAHEWRNNWELNLHFGCHGILEIFGRNENHDKSAADWESRIGQSGSLEAELCHYLALGIAEYERRDIPVHTPQILLLLLKYPGSVGYRVFNEYRTVYGEPYGVSLCGSLEEKNKYYEQSYYHFNKGMDFNELLGIRRAEELRREKNLLCVSENLLWFAIMEDEERSTVRELKNVLGNGVFEEIKQKVKRDVTPVWEGMS